MVAVWQISKKYTHYAAILLFVGFGLRSLYDAATESGVRSSPAKFPPCSMGKIYKRKLTIAK